MRFTRERVVLHPVTGFTALGVPCTTAVTIQTEVQSLCLGNGISTKTIRETDGSTRTVTTVAIPGPGVALIGGSGAVVTSGNPQWFDLNAINGGLDVELNVIVDGGVPVVVTFSAGDPLTPAFNAVSSAQAASVFNARFVALGIGAVASSAGGYTHVTSSTMGGSSSVQITAGGVGTDANDAVNGFNFPLALFVGSGAGEFYGNLNGNEQVFIHVKIVDLTPILGKFNVLYMRVEFQDPDHPDLWFPSLEGAARTDTAVNHDTAITQVGYYIFSTRVEHTGFRRFRVRFYWDGTESGPNGNTEIWVTFQHNGGRAGVPEQ